MGARERQRAATRAAIIDAATAAFTETGYVKATVAEIARRADVSPESVYLIFTNKRELFRAVLTAAAVGDRAAVVDESWLADVRREPDQRRRLEMMADATRDVLRRAAALDDVARAAAASDPDIAAMRRANEERRLQDARALVALLIEAGPLRVPPDEAAELIWALSRSTDLYRALTVDLGWDDERAFEALNDVVRRVLLAD